MHAREDALIYCKTGCAKCRPVQAWLAQRGIPFQVRDVLADPTAFEELLTLGFSTTPVTVVAGHAIAGTDLRSLEPWLQERLVPTGDAGNEPGRDTRALKRSWLAGSASAGDLEARETHERSK